MNTSKSNRSSQLMPLSCEHAEGAVFIKRIREGISKTATERLREYTLWYWKNHIRPHFFQEEKIVLPYIQGEHGLTLKLKEDHTYIRDLVLSLDQHADKHSFIALCDLIDEHVRFEERILFTYLENNLTKEELDAINQELVAHPVNAGEWMDRFWE